ncbi:monocarboxylate transporter 1-like [Rhipicephalus microplus]|uniref:monocarboxylate transporter 1-like n=1 Tax=Rhipicephalus microplus TaxID=6941 RepID=UPI003F6BD772
MTAPKFAGNMEDSPEPAQNKWVVLGACFTINFMSSAFFRNAALFYPSIMGTFLVTRERAALPLFVYGGCFHLGALLGGTVVQVLTVWAAAVAGGILLSTTFIASSFVNGTAFLTAVLGVLGGTGQGIIFNCSVVGLADYFSSWRGLALGVVMTGAPAASFIFPAIFNYTLEEHGLRGTLLLTGAYMLNIPVLGLLLRTGLRRSTEETWRQSETNVSTTKSKLSPSSRAHHTDKDGSPPTICQSVESLSRSNSDDHLRRSSILRSSKSFRIPGVGGTETSRIIKDGINSNTAFGISSSRPRYRDLGTPTIGICSQSDPRQDLAHLIWYCLLYSGTRQQVISKILPGWRPTSLQAWAQPGRITGPTANELWQSLFAVEYLDDRKA